VKRVIKVCKAFPEKMALMEKTVLLALRALRACKVPKAYRENVD
jgi:hypothetical protein